MYIYPYSENRRLFIAAAKKAGAETKPYILRGYTDPNYGELATDVATIGNPDAERVVVIDSGIHGFELPFGSLLQRLWLSAAKKICSQDKNIRFVFVHALNPFGAAYGLRNDQNNVDVNRNFIDFNKIPETSKSYIKLENAFSPNGLNIFSMGNAWEKMLYFAFVTNSLPEFVQALAGGQYEFPKGICYGGKEPSWSRKTWETITEKHVINNNPKTIWHLDIHTGDGPYGKLQIMINTEENSPLHERVRPLGDPDNIVISGKSFAELSGDLVDFWGKLGVPDGCTITPMTVSVGTSKPIINTLEGIDVLRVMIRRNALWTKFNDDRLFFAERIIRKTREKFYPQDDTWRDGALRQCDVFWKKLMNPVTQKMLSLT